MKVIVRCANNRVTKTEMEQIIESLFQENKDLRVHIGHLRDELNLSQQQSEARRQVICERDKLIQELKAQKEADDKKSEEVCAACNELYEDVLADRNHLREEVARLTNERDTAVHENTELIEENVELRDNLDAVINIKNEYAETIDEMRKKIVAAQSPEFTSHLAKLIIANLPSTDK